MCQTGLRSLPALALSPRLNSPPQRNNSRSHVRLVGRSTSACSRSLFGLGSARDIRASPGHTKIIWVDDRPFSSNYGLRPPQPLASHLLSLC